MTLPVWLLPFVVAIVYLTMFLLERRFPLRKARRPLWPRVLVNVAITGIAVATAAITVRPAVEHLLALSPQQNFGALALLELPLAAEFAIAFVLFDWSFYWWHRLNHRVPLLWRFHNVHHVDPDLDVTTAFRFHAVEIGYSSAFRATQVLLIGPAAWMYFMYELVFQVATLFHHSNVKLPLRIERAVNRVFVTPRMHGVHHSHFHTETDSNYSTVLSWWDRLHRSLRLNVPQEAIRIGVPAYSQPADNRPGKLLRMPFAEQRTYWRQDGATMEARPASRTPGPANRMHE
ncbi:MAG: sterol desaturase family protein [Wenzhouxiangellaceae bacterium]|jgi:sterol desaturase/sphingolipid hydroxylase (fatty acid hydroxylase superfamily)|nr:sterol desaturase family protein [Wenzhouxiangellaceae bacterium]MBS3746887.1 sterol desaturase family protein [Wenzhouxiangellaceae bacterium]